MIRLAPVLEDGWGVKHAAPRRPKLMSTRRVNKLLLLTGVDDKERERLLARLQKVK